MGNYDENGNYIPDDSEIEPTRPYSEEELAERRVWCDQMSDMLAFINSPMSDD